MFKNGNIKVGNLGEPKNIKELVTGAQNSIWAYMSPEMLSKKNHEINEKTDIWYQKIKQSYCGLFRTTTNLLLQLQLILQIR